MRSFQTALLIIFMSALLQSVNGSEIEYFQMTPDNKSFNLEEGETGEVIGSSNISPRSDHYIPINVGINGIGYEFRINEYNTFKYPTFVGPCSVTLGNADAFVFVKITRAETTPTVTPTSAAANTLLSGWTWMETYPLIFNESSDTWFYLMPVVIDGTATNWLYNYSTEEWTPLATE